MNVGEFHLRLSFKNGAWMQSSIDSKPDVRVTNHFEVPMTHHVAPAQKAHYGLIKEHTLNNMRGPCIL